MLPHDGSKILLRTRSLWSPSGVGTGFYSIRCPSIKRAKRNVFKYFGDNTTVDANNALIPIRLHLLKMHALVY